MVSAELRDDDLPQAFTRAAIYNCYADQLNAIEDAVTSGNRAKLASLAKDYRPVTRTWDEEAWKAAMASQVLVNSARSGWPDGRPLMLHDPCARQAFRRRAGRAAASTGEAERDGNFSREQQDRLFDIIALLRRYNQSMTGASLVLMRQEASVGLTLTKQEKASLLAEARKAYGKCVAAPSPELLNLKSQLAVGGEKAIGRR